MPPVRRWANAFSSAWVTGIAGQQISDSQCGYRLYRRAVLESVPVTPGRYEVESEMAVRAARLGFRVTELLIPTVYADETSHLNPFKDAPRIFAMLVRLTLERLAPPPEMKAALARRGSRTL
jgi:hypothetical protein